MKQAVGAPSLRSCKCQAYQPRLGVGGLMAEGGPEKPHPLDASTLVEACVLYRIPQSIRYGMQPEKREAGGRGESRSKAAPEQSPESLRG